MVKQKKILLVSPACLDDRISGEDAGVVPIGLFYIAALLLSNGFSTKIINLAETKKDPLKNFTQTLQTDPPDIIGFSVANPTRWSAIECAKTARNILPDATLVFGGPAPTFMPDHLFDACPELDYIVSGEGEMTFLELANTLEKNNAEHINAKTIKGLVFKKEGSLIKTQPREPLGNLDELVHPSKYFTYQHLAMSRGCPGKCTFCGSPQFWSHPGVRYHSPQWFADEIEQLVQKGIHHFYISDDTFTMDKKQVLTFCDLLIQKKLKLTWNAISRADYLDEEILFSMRRAGCIQISFGVESGSKTIRKALGKPIGDQKIIQAFSLTKSYGILPRAYFIYGSPGETQKTIQKSIKLLKKIKPLGAVFYMLVIFPGTHLYRAALQKQTITDDIWHKKIEDLPWFEIDEQLDFQQVKSFGCELRNQFYANLDTFAKTIELKDKKELYPLHADFLSRLALTFSHGEYAEDARVKNQDKTAQWLFEKALSYAPEPRAFLGLAMLHQKKRNFKQALTILENALTSFPKNPDLSICMGVCLMNTGDFKDALAYFKKFNSSPGIDQYINICRQHIAGK